MGDIRVHDVHCIVEVETKAFGWGKGDVISCGLFGRKRVIDLGVSDLASGGRQHTCSVQVACSGVSFMEQTASTFTSRVSRQRQVIVQVTSNINNFRLTNLVPRLHVYTLSF